MPSQRRILQRVNTVGPADGPGVNRPRHQVTQLR